MSPTAPSGPGSDVGTATQVGQDEPHPAVDPMRFAGHCVVCDRMVERLPDGSCPQGHPPDAVAGAIPLTAGEPLPKLPRFNWGAFLMPPIWGIAHGLWAGAFFVPLWAFVDSAIRSTLDRTLGWRVIAWATLVGTVAFQYEYARTANRLAWRRASERMSLADYLRRERIWAAAMGLLLFIFVVWGYAYLTRS
jgi:hypothetical protein